MSAASIADTNTSIDSTDNTASIVDTNNTSIDSANNTLSGAGAGRGLVRIPPLQHTRFCFWYPLFRAQSIRSVILELPQTFIRYLAEDKGGLVLPGVPEGVSLSGRDPRFRANDSDSESESDSDSASDWTTEPEAELSCFPKLENNILKALTRLGGAAHIKLDWSSPRDAKWINKGSLKCTTPGHVYLLLKSSDFVTKDLNASRSLKLSLNLVLTRWCDLRPWMFFRTFVWSGNIYAISQKDASLFNRYVPDNKVKIVFGIRRLFEIISLKFPKHFAMVFDCYVDRFGVATLTDFESFDETTDPCMFSWPELRTIAQKLIKPAVLPTPSAATAALPTPPAATAVLQVDAPLEFRFVKSPTSIAPSDDCFFRLPTDIQSLGHSHGEKIVDFVKQQNKT